MELTERLIKSQLRSLLRVWFAKSRVSAVYCAALEGHYKTLELNALIGAQEAAVKALIGAQEVTG